MSGLLSACIFKDLCSVPTTFFLTGTKRGGAKYHTLRRLKGPLLSLQDSVEEIRKAFFSRKFYRKRNFKSRSCKSDFSNCLFC